MSAAHVLLEKSMWDRLFEINEGLPEDSPLEGRLPAPNVVLEIENYASLLFYDDGDHVAFGVLNAKAAPSFKGPVLRYLKRDLSLSWATNLGGPPTGRSEEWPQKYRSLTAMTFKADLLFSLMAEPRFIREKPFTKNQRKAETRQYGGVLPHTWVKLGWMVGGSTTPKSDRPGSAPARAFHMVRAHWRSYGDHQTPKGGRRPGRPGWWVWIEAFYSGNPALGEIKHHYMPKLEDPGRSSRLVHANVASRIASGLEKILP